MRRSRGVALIMVLLVLSALAMIGAPFVISMSLQDKASLHFAGGVAARAAAEAARNHAIAHLERTVYGYEFEEEEETLDSERPRTSVKSEKRGASRTSAFRPRSSRTTGPKRRGLVVRRDLGQKPLTREEKERQAGRMSSPRRDPKSPREKETVPDNLTVSKKGPSPREFDVAEELETRPLGTLALKGETVMPVGSGLTAVAQAAEFRFQDPTGVSASAFVTDEQGKVNLNSAPPNLIANLFGVSRLMENLAPTDEKLLLEDASMFRGDDDPKSIDGAVVIADAASGVIEAVTYRKKTGNLLEECSRGAFLSIVLNHVFPAGSFVYDLRGWKAGYHRLWAEREGGFHPRELTRFRCVEAIREIAGWQISSLFVSRFRGEGLTADLLRQSGVNMKKVSEMGLDPYLFDGQSPNEETALKAKFEDAKKRLRKLGLSATVVEKLKEARGVRVVVDLAARLDGADKPTIQKTQASLEKSLASDKRRPPKIPERYLATALKELSEVYATPGIETVGPEELEWIRDVFTVSSQSPVEWSEAEVVVDDVSLASGDGTARISRASTFNPLTVLRIRSLTDESVVEFNEAAPAGKGVAQGGIRFAYPLQGSLKGYDATVQGLVRHPVNINTASRRVLRAIFTGVRGLDAKQIVTPFEADQLAIRVEQKRPFKSHSDFHDLLDSASSAKAIDPDDVQPLLLNAICPTSNLLLVSTTGFTYASGDIYSIESRGVARSPAGTAIAEARFREIVEVSASRRLTTGLMTQADYADGIFLRDPMLGIGFPENRHEHLIEFPGTRSHLVYSRPLLLHRAPLSFPAGDLSTLRLFPAETSEKDLRYTLGTIEHFRNTYEGYELAQGEPWTLNLSLNQASGSSGGGNTPAPIQPRPGPQGGAGTPSYLNMVPGGLEFWFRMRTYPEARSRDGHLILFDAGIEEERNRIQMLYADRMGRVLLRIYDASVRDPSIPRTVDNGQYLEVAAQRPLELETWYHLRAVWDGTYGGGAQLFIDGIPAGTDNLSTELATNLPASGGTTISVKDASKFPQEGVVRIDQELFEYSKSGNSLRIRQEPPGTWQPLPRFKRLQNLRTGRVEPPEPEPPKPGGKPGGGVGPKGVEAALAEDPLLQVPPIGPQNSSGTSAEMTLKRAPGNRRGSTPSEHFSGARVSLHGYSLEMRRKERDPVNGAESQIPDNDGNKLVWGTGGLRSQLPINAFNFPRDVEGICHFDPPEQLSGGPAGGATGAAEDFIVPLFHLSGTAGTPILLPQMFTAILPGSPEPRDAIDYFQDKGVCMLGGSAFLFRKEPLPPFYAQVQAQFQIVPPQTKGLRILGSYPPAPGQDPLAEWKLIRKRWHQGIPAQVGIIVYDLTHRSLQANGKIQGLYPPTGILELRGSPTPWEKALGRRDTTGQPLLTTNPDDSVEWIRYAEIFDQPMGGEDFHLFVGRRGGKFNFRGYPERDDPTLDKDYRKQLDHRAGEPLRLVMELSEGGAGWGDYVCISARNPSTGSPIYEPSLHRVYKVLEHEDGRFFASFVDVGDSGAELRESIGKYQNNYTMAMNPRLVKFPTWSLPEIGAPTGLIFGDTLEGSPTSRGGRPSTGGLREDEDEDPTGITLDEVRLLQNRTIQRDPRYTVRHVIVPLEGGTVQLRQSPGFASIGGRIPAERGASRSGPIDVLVVTLSRERGLPELFAQGVEEGLIRIGDELFYFEDPLGPAGAGGRRGSATIGQVAQNPNQPNPNQPQVQNALDFLRERDPLARSTIVDNIPVAGVAGRFEPEGFVRIEDLDPERSSFHEVVYYKRFAGGFSQCLRGQFGTPILQQSSARVQSVSRRLRLIGRGLLGTRRAMHTLGDAATLVPYANMQPVTGPLTGTGLPVKRADRFGPSGYLLLDSGEASRAWEIMAHLGPSGEGLLGRPRDERGRGILRSCFGTKQQPISLDMFAYEMPYRYPDRFELEVDSPSLAYLQKSFRVPGAYWRSIEWTERPSRTLRERRSDIVILARFDGKPEWDAKPTNAEGGLYLFEEDQPGDSKPSQAELNRWADQVEIRVYFRFPSGAFTRLPDGKVSDDWKETPVLDSLYLEYEKAGAIVRHEELPF